MNTPHQSGSKVRLLKTLVAASAGSSLLLQMGVAHAASSWSPTLLVNTESFQTIDDGDGATDLELRFGGTLNERVYWDVETAKFQFTDDVHVEGNLTVTGALITDGAIKTKSNLKVHGTLSGNTIEGFNLSDCDGDTQSLQWDVTTKTFVCGDDDTGVGTLTQDGADARFVNQSGDTMTGNLVISNNGTFAASGSIRTESDLTINQDNGAADAILTFGNDAGAETIRFNDSTNNFTFSDDIDVTGTVNTTGNITSDADLTINEDNGAADAILTFGNDAGAETVRFSDTTNRFEFSDDLKVTGNLSGSTLTIDGAVTLRGQTYNFPINGGTSGSVLRTDGVGNLAWSTGVNEGSGDILTLNPEYAGATYFGSGSAFVGQLSASGTTNAGNENTYEWNSTKASIQDYWISVRVRVPDNFVRWDPVKSLQLRYRTATASAAQNHITVKMRDTAGTAVALTGGSALNGTAFATANITGPSGAGTFTPGGYVTVLIKMAASSAGQANAGHLTFHWETKTP